MLEETILDRAETACYHSGVIKPISPALLQIGDKSLQQCQSLAWLCDTHRN